jgi:DDE superfamily endonuclease
MDISAVGAKGVRPCVVLCQPTDPPFPQSSWLRRKKSCTSGPLAISSGNGPHWSCSSMTSRFCPILKPRCVWICTPTLCGSGADAGLTATLGWKTSQDGAPSPVFPPLDHAMVKAIACEVVYETARPLSRQSLGDLTARACRTLGQPISRSTVWRMLHADALKPWRYEYWIFPRDPQFAEKAAVVLDLYAGVWEGHPLSPRDHILSADEKTSIQARLRCHPSLGPAPGRHRRVEFEYDRGGALQYLAAWDVGRGYVMGHCEPSTGIEPFGRLVTQVMEQEPYRSAERVFWVVDNGSSHRGQAAVQRLMQAYPNAILVHTPIHASWLNQVEIYFSLVQRKVLTPNDFAGLTEVAQRLRLYEELCNQRPRPFQWNFTREKLIQFLDRLEARQITPRQALPAPEKSRQVA